MIIKWIVCMDALLLFIYWVIIMRLGYVVCMFLSIVYYNVCLTCYMLHVLIVIVMEGTMWSYITQWAWSFGDCGVAFGMYWGIGSIRRGTDSQGFYRWVCGCCYCWFSCWNCWYAIEEKIDVGRCYCHAFVNVKFSRNC